MRWWDELWLNEGLATWMSDCVVIALDPARAGQLLDVADKRSASARSPRRAGAGAPRRSASRPTSASSSAR